MKNITPKKAPTGKNRRQIVTPDEINSLFVKSSNSKQDMTNNDYSEQQQKNDINANNNDNNNGGFIEGLKNSFNNAFSQIEVRQDNANNNNNDETDETDDNENDEAYTINEYGNSQLQQQQQENNEKSLTTSSSTSSFNPNIKEDELFPKWLINAEKEKIKQEKERLAIARGKKKKKITDDWRFWAAIITGVGFATAFYSVYQQTGGLDSNISPFNFNSPTSILGGGSPTGGGSDELII